MERSSFQIYKGLQMPLVFKGLKGKYIYIALGSGLSALITMMILMAFVNLIVGLIAFLLLGGCGSLYVYFNKDKGLQAKKRYKGVYVIPPKIR